MNQREVKVRKVFYIAGPYRGDSKEGVISNIKKAREVSLDLWIRGYAAVCPHMNTAFFDHHMEDRDILEGDLAILSKCDGIVVLPGWESSQGTLQEIRFAGERDIPTYLWTSRGRLRPIDSSLDLTLKGGEKNAESI